MDQDAHEMEIRLDRHLRGGELNTVRRIIPALFAGPLSAIGAANDPGARGVRHGDVRDG